MHLRLLTITSLIAGIGLAVSAIAQPAVPTKEMVVTPFEQVKFVPIDPIKPNGDQIAVAEGTRPAAFGHRMSLFLQTLVFRGICSVSRGIAKNVSALR